MRCRPSRRRSPRSSVPRPCPHGTRRARMNPELAPARNNRATTFKNARKGPPRRSFFFRNCILDIPQSMTDTWHTKPRIHATMTEQELKILRQDLRIFALETLVATLIRGLARSSPAGVQELKGEFQKMRESCEQIALKGVRPEYADMVTDEFRVAMDDLLSFIESQP